MRGKILRGLLALAGLLVLVAALALAYRGWRQGENARALSIQTPNGIEETQYVRLGGIDQWIQIRGEDRNNPVLLFVHGGPGSSESPMSSLFRPWEKYFTVVMWDQRDAGKTFARNGAVREMSIARVAHDGIELAEFLRRHLHTNKIVVLGHSWGTMVGVRMVKDRPDLFSAYVGTGQVVSIAEKEPEIYARTMARLRAARDEAGIHALAKIGPPPYKTSSDLLTERTWSTRHDIASERDLYSNMTPVVLFAPGWSLWDIYEFMQASNAAEAATFDADASYDARDLGSKFEVPFFIFNGELDNVTPADLAKRYFDSIQAPMKQFVLLKGAGHSAVLTEPDIFLQNLVARVRPIAVQGQSQH
jgi:pimeloyl-ACP methyl ester carboxylesterase